MASSMTRNLVQLEVHAPNIHFRDMKQPLHLLNSILIDIP